MDKNNEYLPSPVNANERYMHAIVIRLDALCHMMSDFVDAYGKVNELAVEEVKVEEKNITETKERKTTSTRKPRAKKQLIKAEQ